MLIYPLSYFSKKLKIIKFLGTSPNSVKQTEAAVKQTMASQQYSYIPIIFLLHINDLPDADLREIVDWGRKWLVDFNAGKTQLVLFDRSNNIENGWLCS